MSQGVHPTDRERPRTHPIVLAHGIARFDVLLRAVVPEGSPLDDETHYFRRIRSTLDGEGFDVHHGEVPWAESVTNRAQALWNRVRTLGPKVHIIAHSMGGLDARHMLRDFRDEGAVERVASLTTIGTPHLGTSFADWGLEQGDELLTVLRTLGIDGLDGFRDLSTSACESFDEQVRDFEQNSGVLFQTYAGTQSFLRTFAPLKFSWLVIRERDGGANDGLVPLLGPLAARLPPGDARRGSPESDRLVRPGRAEPPIRSVSAAQRRRAQRGRAAHPGRLHRDRGRARGALSDAGTAGAEHWVSGTVEEA